MPTQLWWFIGSIVTAWFGYRGFHNYALIREKKARFDIAGLVLREEFANELNALNPLVIGSETDAFEVLEQAFPKHLKAITEFRPFLTGNRLKGFDKAWAEYDCYDGDKNQHFLEQYSIHIGSITSYKESCKLAIERINKILEFTNT